MTGTFPASVTQGLRTVSGTAGPADVNNIQAPQAGDTGNTAPAQGASEYNVPYTLQTGTVRYAPMPPMAQTKITAKNASPQWPTSAYTVYKQIAGTPNAVTTQTAALTFSISSREATVGFCHFWREQTLTVTGCCGWSANRCGDAKILESLERLISKLAGIVQVKPRAKLHGDGVKCE